MDYLLILLAISFISISQILQKLAVVNATEYKKEASLLRQIAVQQTIWWAIASLAVGTLLWLIVLYRMEVSQAVPFLSLGFILVLLASRYYFKESISKTRWAGVVLIIMGIIVLSRT